MNNPSTTVREAIERGKDIIDVPSRAIMISGTGLCVVLLLVYPSLWDLLLILVGVFSSLVYSKIVTIKWRIWAYENVNDIQQFQRSAELSGLLMRRSYDQVGSFASYDQRTKLKVLIQKFSEDAVFVDDLSIPKETAIYSKSFGGSQKPIVTLNDNGINVLTAGFCEWNKIENERIAVVGKSYATANSGNASRSSESFRFEYLSKRIDIELSSIKVTDWELDLFLYIYRGRFNQKYVG